MFLTNGWKSITKKTLGQLSLVKEELIAKLLSGDDMIVDENGCSNTAGQRVLMFSNKFKEEIMVKKENTEKEIEIILPEIHFEMLK